MKKFALFFFSAILFNLSHTFNSEQQSVFQEFYRATGGNEWTNRDNWETDDPCSYYGVICDTNGGIKITLPKNNLEGFLPPSFGTLPMVALDLSNNNLNGQIPASLLANKNLNSISLQRNSFGSKIPDVFTEFHSLRSLNLEKNKLEGEIPDSLFLLSNLTELKLGENLIEGFLSPKIGNLKKLNVLSLENNAFNGSIPSSIGNIPFLISFGASTNSFTSLPAEISKLIYIKSLTFSNNKLENFDFGKLCSLRYLQELDLSINYLNGSLPECIEMMESLQSLRLQANFFHGSLPLGIYNLTNLKILQIDQNSFEGTLDPQISNMKNLNLLTANFNHLTGQIPSEISRIPYLTVLSLRDNKLNGNIPESIGSLSQLRELILDHNQLEGSIPLTLSKLLKLNLISLSYNKLTGNTLGFVENMTLLQSVDISHNNLSGNIPNTLGKLTSLVRFDISYNRFTGDVPTELPPFSALSYIDISHNELSGILTTNVQYLTSLTTILASNNKITGTIPATIAFIYSLQVVDLSSNRIYGTIPSSFGGVGSATHFNLADNLLTGELPPAISKLTKMVQFNISRNFITSRDLSPLSTLINLEVLDLSHNLINAEIPDGFSGLDNLEVLDLSYNSIVGSVPTSFASLRNLRSLSLDHNVMEGEFPILNSDPNYIDLSSNSFQGNLDFMNQLASIQYLNLSGNGFSGSIPDVSGKKKLTSLDMSFNEISGKIPNFDSLTSLTFLDLSFNDLIGSVPQFHQTNSLKVLRLNNNLLNDSSLFSLDSAQNCTFTSNLFECPISSAAKSLCQAQCTTKAGQDQKIQVRIDGTLKGFDSESFLTNFAQILKISKNRLRILSTKEGSVIIDLLISSPDKTQEEEGSAERIVQKLNEMNRSEFESQGIKILNIGAIPTESDSLSGGAIAGIVIGCLVFATIVAIVIAVLVMRKRKSQSEWANSDLNFNNLPKKAIVDYNELTQMSKIGHGAFGIVYKARWRSTNVAVKQLLLNKDQLSQSQLDDFIGEVVLLQSLRPHPNVVGFIGITVAPYPLSMITQLCDCGNVQHYLQENSEIVTLSFKRRVINEIASGMFHLHSENVVHRDLSARNILLTRMLEAKVSDFGLSRQQDQTEVESHTKSNVGPLKWMAPESLKDRKYSKKSDVFSFGITVWEILNESEPYPGTDALNAAMDVVNCDLRPTIPEETPPDLVELMTSCWHRDPSFRPTFGSIIGREEGDKLRAESDEEEDKAIILPEVEINVTYSDTNTPTVYAPAPSRKSLRMQK